MTFRTIDEAIEFYKQLLNVIDERLLSCKEKYFKDLLNARIVLANRIKQLKSENIVLK